MTHRASFKRAYAVVRDSKRWGANPITINAQLPIFWLQSVAKQYADEYGGRVIPVRIEEESHNA